MQNPKGYEPVQILSNTMPLNNNESSNQEKNNSKKETTGDKNYFRVQNQGSYFWDYWKT